MSLLALESVDKTYDDRQLLKSVSFIVGDADRIGLVGPNGCGKSTLLRLLAGEEEPDDGLRTARRDLRVGYLSQEPVLDPGASVREVVRAGIAERSDVLTGLERVHDALAAPDLDEVGVRRLLATQAQLDDRLHALGGHDIEHRIESTIHEVGLPDADAPCGPLSGGERRRVAIARLMISAPDLLLLDEPTNHLDAEVIDWLEDRLLQMSGALVLVTHDRYFLDRAVDRIVEVDRGRLFTYQGGYREYVEQRAERFECEERTEATRLNLLRRETAWIRRGAPARTSKSRARIQRFEQLRDDAPELREGELSFRIPCGQRLGEKVLELHGVHKAYGGPPVIAGLDLEVGRGERIGIVGPNGAGKSTLLRLCTGLLQPDAGEVVVGPTVRFSYVDQSREGLDPGKTVIEEVGRGNDHVFVDGRPIRIESFLDGMLFTGTRARTRVADLSGGERNRVLLAKLLATAGNVLVLDEPTNDLDLSTLQVLEGALIAFPGTVLVVSHDRWFLDRVATRIVHLDVAGRHRVWTGDVSLLLERLAAERAELRAAATIALKKQRDADVPRSRARRLSNWERRELDELPERIAEVERALADIDVRLADPALYTTGQTKARSLTGERAGVQERVDQLYVRWEELEAIATGA